ncbi:MAG: hypothetical protein JWQ46_1694, partial [Phenylobacterium sp.]|nr:hypothetical protein [Phenylobacterium sp.]MDB5466932.1 hypothetical protein [Phenylobacterium sp.]
MINAWKVETARLRGPAHNSVGSRMAKKVLIVE